MPSKPRHRGSSGNHLINFKFREVKQPVGPDQRSPLHRPRKGPGGGAAPDSALLRRAYVLQRFSFVLCPASFASGKATAAMVNDFDTLVPWETVKYVVYRDTFDEFVCPICLERPAAPRITSCGHVFCFPCVLRHFTQQKTKDLKRTCPVCSAGVVPSGLRPCVFFPVEPLKAAANGAAGSSAEGMEHQSQQLISFVHVSRLRRSPLVFSCSDEVNMRLLGGLGTNTTHQQQQQGIGGVGGSPSVVLPLYDDPSATVCRYCLPTPVLDAQVLETDLTDLELRFCLLDAAARPLTDDDAAELDAVTKSLEQVNSTSNNTATQQQAQQRQQSSHTTPSHAASCCDLECEQEVDEEACPLGHRQSSSPPQSLRKKHHHHHHPATPYHHQSDQEALRRHADPNVLLQASSFASVGSPGPPAADAVYDLYQAADGQQVYLHLLNVRMLKEDATSSSSKSATPGASSSGGGTASGSGKLPDVIHVPILELECITQSAHVRESFKHFGHVPLYSTFTVAFVDLSSVVTGETLSVFGDVLSKRRAKVRSAKQSDDAALNAEGYSSIAWEKYKNEVLSTTSPLTQPNASGGLDDEDLQQLAMMGAEGLPELDLSGGGQSAADEGVSGSTRSPPGTPPMCGKLSAPQLPSLGTSEGDEDTAAQPGSAAHQPAQGQGGAWGSAVGSRSLLSSGSAHAPQQQASWGGAGPLKLSTSDGSCSKGTPSSKQASRVVVAAHSRTEEHHENLKRDYGAGEGEDDDEAHQQYLEDRCFGSSWSKATKKGCGGGGKKATGGTTGDTPTTTTATATGASGSGGSVKGAAGGSGSSKPQQPQKTEVAGQQGRGGGGGGGGGGKRKKL